MDDRLRPQSDRNPGAAENDSAAPTDRSESSRPTAVIAAGISDSIADVLGRFPGYPGHEVRLTIPPGSALFLTAAEFRALKEASDRAGIATTVETEDPLRRQLAVMFGLKTHNVGAPTGPRLLSQSPDREPSTSPPAATPVRPGQIVPLPTSPPVRGGQARASQSTERTRLGRTPRSTAAGHIERTATWARPVEGGPKGRTPAAAAPTGGADSPAADHHDEDRTEGRRRTILIVVAAVIALVLLTLAALAVAKMTLTTATVDIELRSQTIAGSSAVEFVAGGVTPSDGAIIVPAQYVTVDVTVETSAPATGVDRVGVTPAVGTVQLANPTDQAIEIPAGTAGTGDTGVEFTFSIDVTVPPATESAPGEAEAAIETTTLGTAANLDPGDLSGVLESGVFFSNRLQTLTGGTDQEGKVVSEDDIEAARSAAADALTNAANDRFAQTLQSNVMAIPSTYAIEENDESFDHEAGDAAEAVTRRAEYSVTALTYSVDEFERAVGPTIAETLSASIPDGYALEYSSIRIGIPEVSSDGDPEGVVAADVPANARAIASFTPEQEAELTERLEGADDDEASAILTAEPAIESFTIEHSPEWLARGMPGNSGRIEIRRDD